MEDYGPITALAYAAYRPDLHGLILDGALEGTFGKGLDIGCGVGHSTHALAAYCKHTVGSDISEAMLRQAVPSEGIEYRLQREGLLPFPDRWFDVVTLAGSWPYCKSQAMLEEIIRVCRPGAEILIYDFDMEVGEMVLNLFGIPSNLPAPSVTYNHEANFGGYNINSLEEVSVSRRHLQHTEVDYLQLAYLILSDARTLPSIVDALWYE